jgi:hypothetical protein
MNEDCLYLIFDFLNIQEKFQFGAICKNWRIVFKRWLCPSALTFFILNQKNCLKCDDLFLLAKLSKKYNAIAYHLIKSNKSVKTKWYRNDKLLHQNPKSRAQSDNEQNPLCYMISELGFGIWICNRSSILSKIKIVSFWGQELELDVDGLNVRLYHDCLYYHHCLEHNCLIVHSMSWTNEIVTIRIDFSNMENIQAQVQDNCCLELSNCNTFHREHYFCDGNKVVICNYSRNFITSFIQSPSKNKQIVSQQQADVTTFCGPYLVLFVNGTIKLYDLTDDYQEFTSRDKFETHNFYDLLHLKYYPKNNVIYVYGKSTIQSAKLVLNLTDKTFRITMLGNLNLNLYCFEHNTHTNELEKISLKNSPRQFFWGSNRDNSCFFAFD